MTDEKKPPGVENAEEIARLVLEHYIKHYDVVKMKLGHARSATRQSMDELAANQNDRLDGEDRRLREVEAYDRVWEQIIDMFRTAGVSEDDLERIEAILSRIPTLIKKYYDLLVAEDRVLQDLMTELERIEYKQAIAITRKIQEGPDLLSGLDQKEFRPPSATAFLYRLPPGSDPRKK